MMKILPFFLTFYLILLTSYSPAQITFQKTLGGPDNENIGSAQPTTDGGYVVVGTTESFGTGDFDIYLIKTDANGDTVWTKTYGGPDVVIGEFVQQTADGGYIILAEEALIKTDVNGDPLWIKIFGPLGDVYAQAVQQTMDGGYLISGNVFISRATYSDAFFARTDTNGNILWIKTFGGNLDDACFARQTSDGGYIIISTYNPGSDMNLYLMKTDVNGDTLWTKSFGGTGLENFGDVLQTTDGGYIISGGTTSFGAGSHDLYLVKTDSIGNLMWSKTYGGPDTESGSKIQQTADGGYVFTGITFSFGAGGGDIYLIKTDSNGDTLWTKTIGGPLLEVGRTVQQTTDGGYFIGGFTRNFGAVNGSIYLLKTDSNGNSGCYQGNPAFIVTTPANNVTVYPVTVLPGSFVNIPPSITVGNGGIVGNPCATVGTQSTIQNLQTGISIFPDPSRGNFTITFPGAVKNGEIQIFNAYGSKVFSQNIHNTSNTEIHLKNIPGGIYFVKVFDGEKYFSNKIIIQQN